MLSRSGRSHYFCHYFSPSIFSIKFWWVKFWAVSFYGTFALDTPLHPMTLSAPMEPAVAPRATSPQYQIPDHVFVDVDLETGAQWTNVAGAMVLAQKSRRTIYLWMKKGWVVVRRTAGSRPLILVSSLWQDAEIHGAPGGEPATAPAPAEAAK